MLAEESGIVNILPIVAPGTVLYDGLENVLRARTGALIVIGDSEKVMQVVDGGYHINAELNPASLYELAKMDGAIILSSDAKKILLANTHLTPDSIIPTRETGSRHRTAERVAIQTGELVIAISQRRNLITLFKGNERHILREVGTILVKANQALQTLEKYKSVLDQALVGLTALEFEDLASLLEVATVVQRTAMVTRIAKEIELYICELGSEGRLVNMQLEELMFDLEDEGLLVLKDYIASLDQLEKTREELFGRSYEELVDLNAVTKDMGYSNQSVDLQMTPRGYRILRKIPKLPLPVIENLVRRFDNLQNIVGATIEELDEVEGIGEVRARSIKDGLRRLREQVLLDRHI
ncbi:MAG TPA: DNA integrity scanning protein DisA [Firmicutes bacterium]|nr:DNA integrity scanning protein DisA [Bacillota bacterium]HBR29309.1 DNA integrity scanning protein DisA [Bacillota bacterium]